MRTFHGLVGFLATSQCLGENSMDCFVNTGKSCSESSPCDSSAEISMECLAAGSPTKAHSFESPLSCICSDGCASPAGTCSNQQYVRVGGDTQYRIRNSKWSDYYIDLNMDGGVYVENSDTDEDDNKFNIYKVGTASIYSSADPVFLLQSVRWPDHVLKITEPGVITDPWVLYGTIRSPRFGDDSIKGLGWAFSVAGLSSDASTVHYYIGGVEWSTRFLRVDDNSWTVSTFGANDDFKQMPTLNGAWVFDPPLPADIVSSLKTWGDCDNVAHENCSLEEGVGTDVSGAEGVSGSVCLHIFIVACAFLLRLHEA